MKAGIVGAGIIGRLLAFALTNAGHQVHLYDRGDSSGSMSCSMAAAGLLTPLSELERSDLLIYHLGNDALKQHWPTIISQLEDEIYFQQTGCLVISHPRDKADLIRFIDVINVKLNSPATGCSERENYYQKLNHAELCEFEPELTKFDEMYYFPDEAHLDNQSLLFQLGEYLHEKGVEWYENTTISEIKSGKVRVNESTVQYDIVFDCRGMGAKSVFTHLHGIRGELIWLHAPDVNVKRPIRLLHPRYSLYLVPRPNNCYIVGASEIHAEDYSEISVRSTLELLTAAYYLHSGFAEARILKTVTQCRPTLSHYLPIIKCSDQLIAINSLYRHGFLISPTLVVEIMRYLEHGSTSLRYPQLWEYS